MVIIKIVCLRFQIRLEVWRLNHLGFLFIQLALLVVEVVLLVLVVELSWAMGSGVGHIYPLGGGDAKFGVLVFSLVLKFLRAWSRGQYIACCFFVLGLVF